MSQQERRYIVELEPGKVWLAPWPGDPGRTTNRPHAKQWEKASAAQRALELARRFGRPFAAARVVEL